MKLKDRILAVLLTAAGLSVLPASAALGAPGGYGPSAPTGPAGTPGGFTSVMATRTVSSGGATVTSEISGGSVTVIVPEGAFSTPVQIEITKPELKGVTVASLTAVGFSGFESVAGVGVKVLDMSGNPVIGTFAKPLGVTVRGAGLGVVGEKVLRLEGASSASVVDSIRSINSITVQLLQDPNLVVVNPTRGNAQTVPGATQKSTGKPYTGEATGAGLLLAAGAGFIAFSRRGKVVEAKA